MPKKITPLRFFLNKFSKISSQLFSKLLVPTFVSAKRSHDASSMSQQFCGFSVNFSPK